MSDKVTKYVILASILVASLSIAYYFIIFIPSYNNSKLEFEKTKYENEIKAKEKEDAEKFQDEFSKSLEYSTCTSDAFNSYSERWKSTCKKLGQKRDCLLPNDTANSYDRSYESALDQCERLYK